MLLTNINGCTNLTPVCFCLSVPTDPFLGKATVNANFVRVDVVTTSGSKWSDVHMQVSPKEEVSSRPVTPSGIPLDIALVMYDSTSTANFKRKMPNTLEYLTKDLNSILLEGIYLNRGLQEFIVLSGFFSLWSYKRILDTIIKMVSCTDVDSFILPAFAFFVLFME